MVDQIFLTPAELAARLAVKVGWVYRRTQQGAINPLPHVHVGKALRFRWEEVEEWLKTSGSSLSCDNLRVSGSSSARDRWIRRMPQRHCQHGHVRLRAIVKRTYYEGLWKVYDDRHPHGRWHSRNLDYKTKLASAKPTAACRSYWQGCRRRRCTLRERP